jgi:hypothetical protein
MPEIASRGPDKKGRVPPRAPYVPAPTPETHSLLALFRRGALPLSTVRSTAIASGMEPGLVETAIAITTKRGELLFEAARDGTVLARRVWP